ncbi:hypothetical protein HAX54_041123 [Datura stramonium]|uniref:Uncharacterized protein n=1 Tax=Datura stramonium TaxID=4076 RepID=A0ABS8RNZ5_DATST|nr:hypothetical protein [Datura stramonium]
MKELIDQPPHSVSWEDDLYSQVLGNEKSEYFRDLGLGRTPSLLWGSRYSIGNIVVEDSSNEIVQRLEHEITELKEKQNEEMNMTKQNQEKLQAELLQMRQFMKKNAPNESMPQDINATSSEQIPTETMAKKEIHNHEGYLVLLKLPPPHGPLLIGDPLSFLVKKAYSPSI